MGGNKSKDNDPTGGEKYDLYWLCLQQGSEDLIAMRLIGTIDGPIREQWNTFTDCAL